jgi:solute carrier family 25 folate transporter 32
MFIHMLFVYKFNFFYLIYFYIIGIFGTLNGTIQMVTYDLMKEKWLAYKMTENSNNNSKDNTEYKLNTVHYSIFSSLSKILATTSTYPFQLVRARIQDQHQTYKNVFEVIGKTFRNEGFYGFYKGLLPCLIRVTPAASITFVVYENLLIFLNRINPNV